MEDAMSDGRHRKEKDSDEEECSTDYSNALYLQLFMNTSTIATLQNLSSLGTKSPSIGTKSPSIGTKSPSIGTKSPFSWYKISFYRHSSLHFSPSNGGAMEDSSKKRRLPEELPIMPPFSGTLEFTSTQPRHRKSEPLILLPTKKTSERDGRPSWSSRCALAGLYSDTGTFETENVSLEAVGNDAARATPALLKVAEDIERGSNNINNSSSSGRSTRKEMEGEKKAAIAVAAEELVQKVMGAWDSSHDPFHALRVRDLALSLASEEGLPLSSFLVVELAALLHDIDDHKYASSRGEQKSNTVESFLKQHNVDTNTADAVLKIVTTMGFKEELGGSGNASISPEFAVVQDADRLDAIGAIGIARAFTYGGSRNRQMYDPAQAPRTSLTKAEYASSDAHPTTINHFAEKLLKLKDLMKSQAGKKRAMQRHEFMVSFLQQFHGEWEGKY